MNRMKLMIIVFWVFFLGSMAASAYAGQFGPPEPATEEGKLSFGVGYFHYSSKWTPQDAGWIEDKIVANQIYFQVGYGFIKNAEAYLRLGAGNFEVSDAFTALSGSKSDFEDSFKPFATLGLKGVFNITSSLGVGPFLQASIYSSYTDQASGTISGRPAIQETKRKNLQEINIGLAVQGKIGKAIIYGGPIVYWTQVDVETMTATQTKSTSRRPASSIVSTASTNYEEKNNFGGFAGLRLPLGKAFTFEVEGQLKSDFSSGASIAYSF